MQKIFTIILLTFLSAMACAQDNSRIHINAHALYKPEIKIFYTGISNPFSVVVSGIAPDSLIVKADKGTLQGRAGEYTISFPVDTTVKESTMLLYFATLDTSGKEQLIDSVRFSVRQIPYPEALVAGKSGGKTTKEVILSADSIVIIMRNCYLKQKCSVLSFNLNFNRDYFLYEFIQYSGSRITAQQKSAILHMEGNAIFYFDHIRVLCPDGVIRTIAPLRFEFINQ